MGRMHTISLLLIVFFSAQIYAAMEKTKACNARIRALEAEINNIQNQLQDIKSQEQSLSVECSDLKKRNEDFAKLPLIPSRIRIWKQSKFEKKIAEIVHIITNLSKERETAESQLQPKQKELFTEKGKLKTFKSITIRSINIDTYGDWDTFAGPEILVTIGNLVIARGAQDSSHLRASLYQDATNHNNLEVYDEDVLEWEYMGSIPLYKNEISLGVSGDTGIKTVEGRQSSASGGFSSIVEYEVEY